MLSINTSIKKGEFNQGKYKPRDKHFRVKKKRGRVALLVASELDQEGPPYARLLRRRPQVHTGDLPILFLASTARGRRGGVGGRGGAAEGGAGAEGEAAGEGEGNGGVGVFQGRFPPRCWD
jgi:hypothetical protein